jgi:hypothetical protein
MDRTSKDVEVTAAHKELVTDDTTSCGDVHHKNKQERRLVLKQDLSIVLLLSGCYWFAYLVSTVIYADIERLIVARIVVPLEMPASWGSRLILA